MIPDATWWYMMVHDGTWWYMMIPDGTWWYLMVPDGTWWYLMVHDDTWWYLMVHDGACGTWWYLSVHTTAVILQADVQGYIYDSRTIPSGRHYNCFPTTPSYYSLRTELSYVILLPLYWYVVSYTTALVLRPDVSSVILQPLHWYLVCYTWALDLICHLLFYSLCPDMLFAILQP